MQMHSRKKIGNKVLVVISTCLLAVSCSNDDTVVNADEELLSLVTAAGITGDPTTGRTLPAVTDAKAKLGKNN